MSVMQLLLVDDDSSQLRLLSERLGRTRSLRVDTAASVAEALTWLNSNVPSVIVSDYMMPDSDGLTLLRELRGSVRGTEVAFILLSAATTPEARAEAWSLDADAVLAKPVEVEELVECIEARVRARRELTLSRQTHLAQERTREAMVGLVLQGLEVAFPGAARRSEELAHYVGLLATQFDLPVELFRDLELAARLHEVGRLAMPGQTTLPQDAGGISRLAASSAALLRPIPGCEVVAELIEGMGALWDGSGHPELQHGQIPLRSRMLRTLHDFLASTRRSSLPPDDAFAKAKEIIATRVGSWYDPAVVVALDVVVQQRDKRRRTEMVPVEHLREGMLLAGDLYAASGVKVLAAGSVLSGIALQTIRQRHESDPMVHGVPIRSVS